MAPRRAAADIATMRKAGRVVAEMHHDIRAAVRPGVTPLQLDQVGRDVLDRRRARSNFLGYHGFPAVICTSVNEAVVHGIPDGRPLQEGDLISVDCGAIIDGWHGDAAFSMGVGDPAALAPDHARLIEVADRALAAGIDALRDGNRLRDVATAIQRIVNGAGMDVVRDYFGHAIGRQMHEDPSVPNYWPWDGANPRLRRGHCFALEPLVVLGDPETVELSDGWTVVTADGGWAAHAEHTIAITDDGPEVLTLP